MTESVVCASDLRFAPSCSSGKERDTESGNDYFGARYYASSMGRFMSPDWSAKAEPVPYAKLDDPQSLNLYGYVNNNPLSAVDPDGHELHIIIVNTSNQSAATTSGVASGVQQKFSNAGVKNVTVEVVNTNSSFKTYMEDAKGAVGPHTATVELAAGPGQEKGAVSLGKNEDGAHLGDTKPPGVSVVNVGDIQSTAGMKDLTTALTNVTAHEVGHDVLPGHSDQNPNNLMSPAAGADLLNNKNAQFTPAESQTLQNKLNTDAEKKQ